MIRTWYCGCPGAVPDDAAPGAVCPVHRPRLCERCKGGGVVAGVFLSAVVCPECRGEGREVLR